MTEILIKILGQGVGERINPKDFHRYRSIIFGKSNFAPHVIKNFDRFLTQQYCCLEFPFKYFDKMANKKGQSENYYSVEKTPLSELG